MPCVRAEPTSAGAWPPWALKKGMFIIQYQNICIGGDRMRSGRASNLVGTCAEMLHTFQASEEAAPWKPEALTAISCAYHSIDIILLNQLRFL